MRLCRSPSFPRQQQARSKSTCCAAEPPPSTGSENGARALADPQNLEQKGLCMPFTENQGTKIYWDEEGKGDPLLLIMGLGYPSIAWYRTRPVLAEEFRTIAFDNRGVGRSEMPPGPYPIPLMASDAAAVLDAAGVDSAHIFGISMGGMIAQEFALLYPKRVRSLILGCTAAGGPTAVRAEPETTQILKTRAGMTPEQAAEAVLPFIYDSETPRERIEEDLAIRQPW